MATPVVAAVETATFLRPENRQTTWVPEATGAAVVMFSTRLVVDNEALPDTDMLVPDSEHARDKVGCTLVSKFTPDTVIVFGDAVVPMVNDTVAVTPVAAAKLLDSTMEGKESTEEIIAG